MCVNLSGREWEPKLLESPVSGLDSLSTPGHRSLNILASQSIWVNQEAVLGWMKKGWDKDSFIHCHNP